MGGNSGFIVMENAIGADVGGGVLALIPWYPRLRCSRVDSVGLHLARGMLSSDGLVAKVLKGPLNRIMRSFD
jgi:hypothetical protein